MNPCLLVQNLGQALMVVTVQNEEQYAMSMIGCFHQDLQMTGSGGQVIPTLNVVM